MLAKKSLQNVKDRKWSIRVISLPEPLSSSLLGPVQVFPALWACLPAVHHNVTMMNMIAWMRMTNIIAWVRMMNIWARMQQCHQDEHDRLAAFEEHDSPCPLRWPWWKCPGKLGLNLKSGNIGCASQPLQCWLDFPKAYHQPKGLRCFSKMQNNVAHGRVLFDQTNVARRLHEIEKN